MQGVITAEVSKCVRDANIQDAQVNSGDYIGFAGKEIITASNDRLDAVCTTADRLGLSSYDICILICGSAPGKEEAERAEAYIRSRYPDKEIYRIDGKQEIYDYILILEQSKKIQTGLLEETMEVLLYVAAAVCAYLIAGVNPAIEFSKKIYHQDIRKCGRVNPGFTNKKRT